jgi:hypothetical protein
LLGNARVSFVGAPFQHDVFVSYAHAERETDESMIRDWSQKLAIRLRTLLSSALNPSVTDGSKFDLFLDDRGLRAGDDLTVTLRDRAERSAILLVLMSPLYPRKSWCLDELHWFLDRAAQDGRGREHCLPVRIQPLPDAAWPQRLKDERGALPVYLDLADPETGLPLDNLETAPASDVVRKAMIQIKGRLEELRRLLEARRAFAAEVPLDRQIVYLHAHPTDRKAWEAAVVLLDQAAIVLPDDLPAPAADDALLQRRREVRLKELRECAALLMLRASDSESFRFELMAFYRDLQQVYQATRRRLPWAIVDRVGGPLPLAERFRVPRLTGDDWPAHVARMVQPTPESP